MSDEFRGVAGLLDSLGALPEEAPAAGRTELVALPAEEKVAKAYELSLRGVPVRQIAAAFGVDESTVYRWKARYTHLFREQFEQESAADIVADALLFLTHCEEVAMYEVDQLEIDATEVDKETGEVKRTRKESARSPRVRYLNAALKARSLKLQLLMDVGVLPKQPERIYHTMRGDSAADKKDEGRDERTHDEVARDVERLLATSRSL